MGSEADRGAHLTPTDLVEQAKRLHRGGLLSEAESAYRQALAAAPEHAEALHYLGLLMYQQGRGAMAIEMMLRALTLRPESPEFHFNLGGVLALKPDRAEDAIELLARAIALRPNYPEAFESLAAAMECLGRSEDARAARNRATDLRAAGGLVQRQSPVTPVIERELFFSMFRGPRHITSRPRGMVTGIEMAVMIALIRSFRCTRLAEFGVGKGANAATILRHCPEIASYIGVDVPPESVPSLAYQTWEVPLCAGEFALGDPRFKLLVREGGTSHTAAEELRPLDFVFIDGDHGVEAVRHDTELARQAVQSGIICWHDYDNPPALGPKTVIDELNAEEGRHICRLEGTFLCFELRRPVVPLGLNLV